MRVFRLRNFGLVHLLFSFGIMATALTFWPLAWSVLDRRNVHALAFSDDGRMLAAAFGKYSGSGFEGGELKVWNLASGKTVETIWFPFQLSSMDFSLDGETLAVGGANDELVLWDVATKQRKTHVTGHVGGIADVKYSPDGKTLATVGGWNQPNARVKFWNAEDLTLRGTSGTHSARPSISFSPDARLLASGHPTAVRIWDVNTAKQNSSFAAEVTCVDFSPNGTILATGDYSGEVGIWNVATGKQIRRLKDEMWHVHAFSVEFSTQGDRLACEAEDGTVRIWDTRTWQLLATVRNSALGRTGLNDINSIAFSPDGKALATWSENGSVILVDTSTGKRVDVYRETDRRWNAKTFTGVMLYWCVTLVFVWRKKCVATKAVK